ncbi:UNVERIFIED_CONTAM: hypothetical protein Sindi_2553000 [Sesamum indicum]
MCFVAFELNHFLRTRRGGREGRIAIKLDIKAYDRIEAKLPIPLCSMDHSLAISIQRGDLLSPYLFTLCAEALSCLFQNREARGGIRRVAVARNAPKVSHLLFAEDTLIFCQASIGAMRTVQDILKLYAVASGQLINFDKSSVFSSRNIPAEERKELTHLGVQIDISPSKYLGFYFWWEEIKGISSVVA